MSPLIDRWMSFLTDGFQRHFLRKKKEKIPTGWKAIFRFEKDFQAAG